MIIASVVGARPNFIKLAALSQELRKVADEVIIHTGQHYDYAMSKTFFDELHISPPDYNLEVGSGTHGKQTGNMLYCIEKVLMEKVNPDAVIVYGDTNSTLAGALAAAKLHIPVIHIEAGERSFDRMMPEELNRVMVDHISDILFCSTEAARGNLIMERIGQTRIHQCGDVIVDLLGMTKPKECCCNHSSTDYNLLTIHREENATQERLSKIFKSLGKTGETFIFPAHPRIRKFINQHMPHNIHVYYPVGFTEMQFLERGASRIVTDSGGVQKEAYLLGKPCITLRATTEWNETLNGGWNILVGTDPTKIIQAFRKTPDPAGYQPSVFGEPGVCQRIAHEISEALV